MSHGKQHQSNLLVEHEQGERSEPNFRFMYASGTITNISPNLPDFPPNYPIGTKKRNGYFNYTILEIET